MTGKGGCPGLDMPSGAALGMTLGFRDGTRVKDTSSPRASVASSGTPPTTRWQQPIDAALTDVFAVQADIAAKVADALGVVLGDSARPPAMVSLKVLIAVGRGDLDGARAAIRAATNRIDPLAVYSFIASYQDMYWVLDEPERREVLASPPSVFDDDRAVWGLVQLGLHELRGDRTRMLAYADSARLALEEQVRAAPEDGQRRVLLGLALAYLGRRAEAEREGLRGVARWCRSAGTPTSALQSAPARADLPVEWGAAIRGSSDFSPPAERRMR
jgi:hypothetical protein